MAELDQAADRLNEILNSLPNDGIWPGFKMTATSRAEYNQALELVEQAIKLAARITARENPRAEPHYQVFELEERREIASRRGEPSPVN
jgi:hypothetical protein